ncbi:predicted protein [Lichtheimia corymbifera JMRC:FSU:9682]|uniref:F-box domain-containing protein n=1 Tax=Lichtheimia corymbifera JMRC:FSU:9682 TaxID=1263082 RepID=A0A068SF54_9FUNG|nr:predicted protein [Lichtheimia corymbifera JMRC:FSU:9682]
MTIDKLTDDCLELVFIHCGACPIIRCILSQVCRRWHVIARRPSVWRSLMLDKPTLVHAYARLLQSPEWQDQRDAIRRLSIRKPYETRRHVHLEHLLPVVMPNVLHVDTLHLCLEEIMSVLKQLPRVRAIHCQAIEPWCASRPFDIHALVQGNSRQVEFQFRDMAGFTTIATTAPFQQQQQHIHTLRVINLRSEDYNQVDTLLKEFTTKEEEEDDGDDDDGTNMMQQQWLAMQNLLVQKYQWIAHLSNLTHLTFGSCYTWTHNVWLQALLPICPQLRHLELHGWRRIGIPTSSTGFVGSIGNDAQQAMLKCFEAAHDLDTLVLVDFWIEPPMLVSAKHLCIRYTDHWPDPLLGEQLAAFMDDLQPDVQDITLRIPPNQIPHVASHCTHPALTIEIQRFFNLA